MELDRRLNVPPRTFRLTTWIDERLNRLGVTTVFSRDCVLAAAVAVASVALLGAMFALIPDLEGIRFGPGTIGALVTVATGQSALICLRRVRPALCLVLVAGCQFLFLALIPADGSYRGIATFIAAYTIGSVLPPRSIAGWAVVAVAVESISGVLAAAIRPGLGALTMTLPNPEMAPNPLTAITVNLGANVLVYTAMPLIGFHMATRRRHLSLVRLRAAEAVKAQRAKARAAVDTERSRLARELHDIAAHHLSGMVVQAAAVERLIDRDPGAAKEATAWIRSQGKETLKNLRLVVGVLRERPDAREGLGADSAPVPGLAVLDALVDTARRLGNPVSIDRRGRQRELPPIADVTLYRVAQEGLSNVRQYAPGAAVRLTVEFGPALVSLAVENDPPPGGASGSGDRQGLGLIGMRERVQLVGGTLSSGPTAAGGWRV
ncbi:MAG: sensor histidine kinase, partial [Stackebrandtia sp.]